MKTALLAASLALGLCACTMNTNSVPSRTAPEEMSISTAADRAADKLAADLTAGGSVFIDATYFDAPDAKYAIGAIRAAIARRGNKLAADRAKADRVVEILLERLRNREQPVSIRLNRGKIYLDSPLFERYFSGHETVALIERDGKFVLLPVFSGAQGGLMIKLINARGDRVVDAVDFFRRFDLDLEKSLTCPVAWNSEMAGLVIDVPAGP